MAYRIIIGAALCAGVLGVSACATAEEAPALKDVFAGKFLIGAALNESQIFGRDEKEAALIARQFNTVTPENCLKWEAVHPEPHRYDFAAADRLVEVGQKYKMFIVGHTLVWHNQTPDWVFKDADGKRVDRATLLGRLREHIFEVVGRYKGRIGGWDVVNEAINDDGSLRQTPWLEIIGEEYIAKAFEYARQADPEAKLYYNDYSMWHEGRRAGVIRLVKSLQAQGIVVDGIGMQGHWGLDYPTPEEIETSIVAYGKLGAAVMITEMDVTVLPSAWEHRGADIKANYELEARLNPYAEGLPESVQTQLAERYAAFFAVFVRQADVMSRVTFWGVQDGNSWLNNWPVRGRTNYPLLFGRDGLPKRAFYAVVETAGDKK